MKHLIYALKNKGRNDLARKVEATTSLQYYLSTEFQRQPHTKGAATAATELKSLVETSLKIVANAVKMAGPISGPSMLEAFKKDLLKALATRVGIPKTPFMQQFNEQEVVNYPQCLRQLGASKVTLKGN